MSSSQPRDNRTPANASIPGLGSREVGTLVLGGGIAGLSVLWRLARRRAPSKGGDELLLLEREPFCGAAASGRNAGIYRHLERDGACAALAATSRALMRKLAPEGLMSPTGAVYLSASMRHLERLETLARSENVRAWHLERGEMPWVDDMTRGGEARSALFVPEDGILDVHGFLEAKRRAALSLGARVRCRAAVERLLVRSGRIMGVGLAGGEEIRCRRLVLAAGAWSASLGKHVGAPLPLTSLRRHLVFLRTGQATDGVGPAMWRVDEQVYARPESGGVLASPCDETPWPATIEPEVDRKVLLDLAARLSRSMPAVANSGVQRLWACLRTFAPDGRPVAGADPRVEGLYWFSGLGGQGLSTALAAAEVVADTMEGGSHPLAEALSPARLIDEG